MKRRQEERNSLKIWEKNVEERSQSKGKETKLGKDQNAPKIREGLNLKDPSGSEKSNKEEKMGKSRRVGRPEKY